MCQPCATAPIRIFASALWTSPEAARTYPRSLFTPALRQLDSAPSGVTCRPSLEVVSSPPPAATTVQGGVTVYPRPDAVRTITTLAVKRPHIGYPEAIFAGVSPGTFTGASLSVLLAQAKASGRALSVPDPDVDRFEVTVEVRIPAHDTGTPGALPGDLDGSNYRIIYSLVEHFPTSSDPTFTLSLNYVDTADIAKVVAPADNSTTIPIPTGRDVRIRLQPLSAVRSNYYGTPEPPPGMISDFIVRKEATTEANLFPFLPEEQLQGFFFQPGNNLPQLLSQQLNLHVQDLTLTGPLGTRVAFGASGALRTSLSADGGTITFTNQAEFLDQWIVAFVIEIARDWTWDGFAQPALTFFRDASTSPIGVLNLPRTVPAAATGGLQSAVNRSTSSLIFFDALKPDPPPGVFPAPHNPKYKVVASFKSAAAVQQSYASLILPTTTRPAQTAKIVSTGIAESPYKAAPNIHKLRFVTACCGSSSTSRLQTPTTTTSAVFLRMDPTRCLPDGFCLRRSCPRPSNRHCR